MIEIKSVKHNIEHFFLFLFFAKHNKKTPENIPSEISNRQSCLCKQNMKCFSKANVFLLVLLGIFVYA